MCRYSLVTLISVVPAICYFCLSMLTTPIWKESSASLPSKQVIGEWSCARRTRTHPPQMSSVTKKSLFSRKQIENSILKYRKSDMSPSVGYSVPTTVDTSRRSHLQRARFSLGTTCMVICHGKRNATMYFHSPWQCCRVSLKRSLTLQRRLRVSPAQLLTIRHADHYCHNTRRLPYSTLL